jgi:hypothetical protein
MNASRPIALLPIVASLVCGCCFHKDLTKSAQVQAGGILGQSFHTAVRLDVIKDTHTHILFLAEQDYPASSRHKRVGVLEAGTELRVNRVERVDELVAILVFLPEYYSWDCTLATIGDGHFAGNVVAVSGKGLTKGAATIGSEMLVSANEANNSLQPTATAH